MRRRPGAQKTLAGPRRCQRQGLRVVGVEDGPWVRSVDRRPSHRSPRCAMARAEGDVRCPRPVPPRPSRPAQALARAGRGPASEKTHAPYSLEKAAALVLPPGLPLRAVARSEQQEQPAPAKAITSLNGKYSFAYIPDLGRSGSIRSAALGAREADYTFAGRGRNLSVWLPRSPGRIDPVLTRSADLRVRGLQWVEKTAADAPWRFGRLCPFTSQHPVGGNATGWR